MGVVEVAVTVVFVVWGYGRVDDAADGGLGFCVGGGDFHFLEAEDVGPVPSFEVCSEGGGWW